MKLQHDCFLMAYNYIRVNPDIIVIVPRTMTEFNVIPDKLFPTIGILLLSGVKPRVSETLKNTSFDKHPTH